MSNDTLPEWTNLKALANGLPQQRVARDFSKFSISLPGMTIDFSRQRLPEETFGILMSLVRACKIPGWRDKLFAGYEINTSEGRPVLHTALRQPAHAKVMLGSENIMPELVRTQEKVKAFSDSIRNATLRGSTGKPFRKIINIGIGGSDSGPRFVVDALRKNCTGGPDVRFVSNVDGEDLWSALHDCIPEETLFLIASKTFTTSETMLNARTARTWMESHLGDNSVTALHFCALTANNQAAIDFGIDTERIFLFPEGVGGRFSLWSSIGLPIAIAAGYDMFRALMGGALFMDKHFCETPIEKNAPIVLGTLDVWNRTFLKSPARACLAYDHRLRFFNDWLQQLEMESNGKHVDRDGNFITFQTAPVIFGRPGTDCQHSFMQMIHQGSDIIPCDFIAVLTHDHPWSEHHRILLANMVAQADALMQGRSLEEADGKPHKTFTGGRPSTIILLDKLDAFHLGMLLALHEHRTFVSGILWGINSFDQFGVELGKTIANQMVKSMEGGDSLPAGSLLSRIAKNFRA